MARETAQVASAIVEKATHLRSLAFHEFEEVVEYFPEAVNVISLKEFEEFELWGSAAHNQALLRGQHTRDEFLSKLRVSL